MAKIFCLSSAIVLLLHTSSLAFNNNQTQRETLAPISKSVQLSLQNIPVFHYRVIKTYPHDTQAFTEGLVYHQGFIYEGTGLEGKSSLRKVDLATGKILQTHQLAQTYFGEGITIWKNKIIQLTWKSHLGFVYDKKNFQLLNQFHYPTEGWGLTHNGKYLIMSDGTNTLFLLDPETFSEVRRIQVTYQGQPVNNINELEYINGEIFANIWQTDTIVRISPATGQVIGLIDLSQLRTPKERLQGDVLNGIAYDVKNKRLFVTGKLWSKLYEIELVK